MESYKKSRRTDDGWVGASPYFTPGRRVGKSGRRRTLAAKSKSQVMLKSSGKEIKSWDLTGSGTGSVVIAAANTTGVIQVLNCPLRNSGYWNRIGDSATGISIHVKGHILTDPAYAGTALYPVRVRAVLIYDRQVNGVGPNLADLLTGINEARVLAGNIRHTAINGMTVPSSRRFRILRDKVWMLCPSSGGAAGNSQAIQSCPEPTNFDWYVKLHGMETRFIGNTEGVASVDTGGLFLVVVSDQGTDVAGATGGNAGFHVAFTSRYKYMD